MKQAKEIVVIGLGNSLLMDEGIGVQVVEKLAAEASLFPEADILEMGVGGMRLLHAIAGRRKAILVDCAHMSTSPGTLRRFAPNEVRSLKERTGLSLHETDVLDVIVLSRSLGEAPEEIVLFGIEPGKIGPGEDLSDTLGDRLPEYVAAVATEIKKT